MNYEVKNKGNKDENKDNEDKNKNNEDKNKDNEDENKDNEDGNKDNKDENKDNKDKDKKNKDYNSWNEILHQPQTFLFSGLDENNLYRWWNFHAIISFKWEKFGRLYYSLIWAFYIIFICFALASTLGQNSIPDLYRKILFSISILLGSVHLISEFRQFLWNKRIYCKDPWNLFGN
jgi:hypothetical protein